MKIGIDATALLPEPTGVDNATVRLLRALARIDQMNDYVIFVNRSDRARLADWLPPNFSVVALSARPRPARFVFQQLLLPLAARRHDVAVVHSPSFIMPLWNARHRNVLTVHDMASFTLPDLDIRLRRSSAYRWAVLASIRRADAVLVPSAFTRSEVLRLVPEVPPARIRVIRFGVGDEFTLGARRAAPRVRERYDLARDYVLYVGTIAPRKNVDVLLDAWSTLVERGVGEELVLAGRLGWDYRRVLAKLETRPLKESVRRLGYVAQDDLPGLYAGAAAFVYPPALEGFGFPPLEAMACGTPVVASDSSALRENLSGAAVLVPPGDHVVLADSIFGLLRDEGLRREHQRAGLARAAQFSWDATAKLTLDCYCELADGFDEAARRVA
jgi:glycosyltransferase involved in cell wall biosynthesis